MRRPVGNSIKLGAVEGTSTPLEMTPEMRSTHLYICGSTGTGKSKTLEYLIRQDIVNWRKSKCGLLLLDPHGSLYESLIRWLAWNKIDRPVVPIDLRGGDWTVGYNVLRPRLKADPAVVVRNFVQAMAYVWGVGGTEHTPQFARVGSNVLWALYEKQMTLLESEYLIDRNNKQLREAMTRGLSKRSLVQDWAYINGLTPRDFDLQVSSTINRLHTFLTTEKLRLMFGQSGASLDFGKALDEGPIILVNLSTEGARVSKEDAALFATLVLSDLWTAAEERGKGVDQAGVKPFYVYIDEFQNFITPTIAENLDQARGYGLHLTLANQFPRQILHTGANGAKVYDSVMANARSKIVFETRGEENLRPLALDLFMGVMDPDEIKHRLFQTKVMDYAEETRTVRSSSENWSEASGDFAGATETDSEAGAIDDGAEQEAKLWNKAMADSKGTSRMNVRGGGSSESEVPFLRPILGQELSSVQFRPLDEQLFKSMAALFDQKQRHAVARLVGMRRPASVVTPTVEKTLASPAMAERYLKAAYEKLPYALPSTEAEKQIADREKTFAEDILKQANQEPTTTRRRVR